MEFCQSEIVGTLINFWIFTKKLCLWLFELRRKHIFQSNVSVNVFKVDTYILKQMTF